MKIFRLLMVAGFVAACAPGAVSTTARIGREGGTIELAGVRVLVPAEALGNAVELTLTVVPAGPDRIEAFLSPTNVTFAREVVMEVRYQSASPLNLFELSADRWVPIAEQRVHPAEQLVAGRTVHAGQFVAALSVEIEDGGWCSAPEGNQDSGPIDWFDAGMAMDGGGWGPRDPPRRNASEDDVLTLDSIARPEAGMPWEPYPDGGSSCAYPDGGGCSVPDGGPNDADGGPYSDGGPYDGGPYGGCDFACDGGGYDWGDGGWSWNPWTGDAGWTSGDPWELCGPAQDAGPVFSADAG